MPKGKPAASPRGRRTEDDNGAQKSAATSSKGSKAKRKFPDEDSYTGFRKGNAGTRNNPPSKGAKPEQEKNKTLKERSGERKKIPVTPEKVGKAKKTEIGYTERKARAEQAGTQAATGKNNRQFSRDKSSDKPERPSKFGTKRAVQPPEKKTEFDGSEFIEFSDVNRPGKWETQVNEGPMTLNKYVAHSGICSRRDAAKLIKEGKVQVNGMVLNEPGYRVQENDKVSMDGQKLTPQKSFVYVLLNKPKDFLTTTEDDRGRRTVMELVKGATDDRLYPIGRLDRNTTGILLLTNDGDLAQKLSHPKFESKKIYQVTLDKDVTKRDFDAIVAGVVLDDGPARVDRLAYLEKKNEIGLEIHSGRNRIVRRIFESLGYDVVKLDRVMYAGLTKKNVSRGHWRYLTDKEIINLKHFKN
ncbi:MAG: pseudouridine synthase [Bacteroidetes bacterium]|nr:pseudouridine synthase [Bacteroidota bacterium]